jgi:hypothetical protein
VKSSRKQQFSREAVYRLFGSLHEYIKHFYEKKGLDGKMVVRGFVPLGIANYYRLYANHKDYCKSYNVRYEYQLLYLYLSCRALTKGKMYHNKDMWYRIHSHIRDQRSFNSLLKYFV